MEKTWASGALELLKHADEHINKGQAFDERIAFISIDNAVETAIRTFISMPFSLSKVRFSFKDKKEIGNSFPKMVSLLNEKANSKITGIELSDIEFYHRLRNQLYHDGTGLSVDKNHLEAYRAIGEILLKNLFEIEFNYSTSDESLSGLIVFWEEIDRIIKQLFISNNIDFTNTFKWEEALRKKILTKKQILLFNELKRIRNEQVHSLSNEINLIRISYGIEIASELRNTFQKDMQNNVLMYFKEHSKEVFSIRAIAHIFSISKKFASQIIETLEQKGKLKSEIEEETGIKLFQIG